MDVGLLSKPGWVHCGGWRIQTQNLLDPFEGGRVRLGLSLARERRGGDVEIREIWSSGGGRDQSGGGGEAEIDGEVTAERAWKSWRQGRLCCLARKKWPIGLVATSTEVSRSLPRVVVLDAVVDGVIGVTIMAAI